MHPFKLVGHYGLKHGFHRLRMAALFAVLLTGCCLGMYAADEGVGTQLNINRGAGHQRFADQSLEYGYLNSVPGLYTIWTGGAVSESTALLTFHRRALLLQLLGRAPQSIWADGGPGCRRKSTRARTRWAIRWLSMSPGSCMFVDGADSLFASCGRLGNSEAGAPGLTSPARIGRIRR